MKRTIKLRESELRNMISESVRRILREQEEDMFADMNSYIDDDGEPIYYDDEGWEYTQDDMGQPLPTGYMYDPEAGEEYQADYEGNRMFESITEGVFNKVMDTLRGFRRAHNYDTGGDGKSIYANRLEYLKNPKFRKEVQDDYRADKEIGLSGYSTKKDDEKLRSMFPESIKRALKENYEPEATYIVFDGTSYYAVYGMDIEDEIADNDVEVVEGPFDDWDDEVDEKIEELNNEAQYGVNWRSHFTPGRY